MTRACGICTLCCKLIPVVELAKKGGERCRHQRQTGCRIYANRPLPCRAWDCRWLSGDDTADQRRPDLSHCVIDSMPDFVTIRPDDGGPPTHVPVVQIWVDPRQPEAWQAKEIMDFLERRGAEGFAAIIRLNEVDATVVFPPQVSQKLFGQPVWYRRAGPGMREHSHGQAEIAAVLTEATGEAYGVGLSERSRATLGRLFSEEEKA